MSRCILLLWAAVLLAQQEDSTNPRTSSADVAQGEKTFRSHCSPCHGLNGEGGRGPNLASGHFLSRLHGPRPAEEHFERHPRHRYARAVLFAGSCLAGGGLHSLLNATARPASVAIRQMAKHCSTPKAARDAIAFSGEGGRLGPDLSQIGQTRSPDFLRLSIVDPAPMFATLLGGALPRRVGQPIRRFPDGRRYLHYSIYRLAGAATLVREGRLQAYRIDKKSKMPSYKNSSFRAIRSRISWRIWPLCVRQGGQMRIAACVLLAFQSPRAGHLRSAARFR